MKKFYLSLSLIVVFAVYALVSRSRDLIISGPNSVATTTSNRQTTVPLPRNPVPSSAVNNTSGNTAPASTPAPKTTSAYKDGNYVGNSVDAYYGNVQVQVAIQSGKITDVQFLDYPHDRGTSVEINTQAMPYLKAEAIQAQSSHVDIVSGATQTSLAFQQSLASALNQAKS